MWPNQLPTKCLGRGKSTNQIYGAVQATSLFWFSSSSLHSFSYSSPSLTALRSPAFAFSSDNFFPSASPDSQQTGCPENKGTLILLSAWWVVVLRMRAGWCSKKQRRRKAMLCLGVPEMKMLYTHPSSQDMQNLRVPRASGISGELRCQTQHSYSAHVQLLLSGCKFTFCIRFQL